LLTVKHGLLEIVHGGYKFNDQPPVYPTLKDVVENLGEFLKTPLGIPSVSSPSM
jgi:hypothetical protein